jgi:MFS family permease
MNKKEKTILIILAMAQFILTLDSTVMNVSISTLVKDLNTTVSGIQGAITFYTLIMAAFMITGAKIGDIIGRKKAFIIGLMIYGVGSLITSLSQNISQLTFGWSLLEGLGAALIIPAMISLIASNFAPGTARIKAYSTVAAMAAIGAGVGPIIGGFLTSYASWRYAFLGEVFIVIYILFRRKIITDAELEGERPKLDILGSVLVVLGLATTVLGILLAGTYGFFTSRKDWVVAGKTLINTGQISPTIVLVIIGAIILTGFVFWERARTKKQKYPLVNIRLFKNRILNSGLGSIFTQQFLLGGLMYSLAIYLQIELQYDALKTGFAMLPLSLMVLLLASRGTSLSSRFAPKKLIRSGFILMILGALWLGYKSVSQPDGLALAPTLALVGAGVGIVASQLQNIVQSSVTGKDSAETSGLMATFQNLGMSFGTALSGVILIGILIFSATGLIAQNPDLTSEQKNTLTGAYETKGQIVSNAQIETALKNQPSEVSTAVVDINAEARSKALTGVFILIGLISILGLLSTRNFPDKVQLLK